MIISDLDYRHAHARQTIPLLDPRVSRSTTVKRQMAAVSTTVCMTAQQSHTVLAILVIPNLIRRAHPSITVYQ